MELAELDVICYLKADVEVNVIYEVIFNAMPTIKAAYLSVTGKLPTITSWQDGRHPGSNGTNSFHPVGLALDIRCRDLSMNVQNNLFKELKTKLQELDPHWDCVWTVDEYSKTDPSKIIEYGHIHLEYDIRKNV